MPHTITGVAAIAVLALTTACGGGTDNTDAFCNDVADIQDTLLNATDADPATVADNLTQLDPPDDIADAYDNVVELYESISDDPDAVTDPDNATRFADLNDDITQINDYIKDNCTDP